MGWVIDAFVRINFNIHFPEISGTCAQSTNANLHLELNEVRQQHFRNYLIQMFTFSLIETLKASFINSVTVYVVIYEWQLFNT